MIFSVSSLHRKTFTTAGASIVVNKTEHASKRFIAIITDVRLYQQCANIDTAGVFYGFIKNRTHYFIHPVQSIQNLFAICAHSKNFAVIFS